MFRISRKVTREEPITNFVKTLLPIIPFQFEWHVMEQEKFQNSLTRLFILLQTSTLIETCKNFEKFQNSWNNRVPENLPFRTRGSDASASWRWTANRSWRTGSPSPVWWASEASGRSLRRHRMFQQPHRSMPPFHQHFHRMTRLTMNGAGSVRRVTKTCAGSWIKSNWKHYRFCCSTSVIRLLYRAVQKFNIQRKSIQRLF